MVRRWFSRIPKSRAARPAGRAFADALEPRVLLAGDVIISEFMAVNTRTLADENGDYSDWIELNNRTNEPIDLLGWHLTDTHAQPDEWTFPDVTLPAGGYLVVFASAKDRATAGQPLHTNFKLSSDGEYLALVRPDLTVADAYDPYPEQKPDMSFGVGAPSRVTSRLVSAPTAAKYLLPSDNALGASWTAADFDDSAWTSAQTGIGYEVTNGTLPGLPAEIEPNDTYPAAAGNDGSANFGPVDDGVYQFTARGSIGAATDADFFSLGALEEGDRVTLNLAGQPSGRGTLADPYVELYRLGSTQPVTFNDDDGAGKDAVIHRFRVPANDTYYLKAQAAVSGQLGNYEVGVVLENGPGTPAPLTNSTAVVAEGEPNDTSATATDASAAWRAVLHRSVTTGELSTSADVDIYRVKLNAGDTVTVVADSTSDTDLRVWLMNPNASTLAAFDDGSLVPAAPFETDEQDARINAFTIGATGLYYVRVQSNNALQGGYRLELDLATATPPPAAAWFSGVIGTNLMAAMKGLHSSALARVPFVATADEIASFEKLVLGISYDDGFVAYLNGTEVARRNAPGAGPLSFDAVATADRPNNESVVAESIDLSTFRNLLVDGQNVLAIHALNASAGDEDFLIRPELLGTTALVEQPPGFFSRPTPRQANPPIDSLGIVADTRFDHDRGFYDAPFDLVISSATPGAQIRYTTDGTPPTATGGKLYTGPVRIAATTTVRAAAFKVGYVPSNVDTETYLFLDDVIRQSPNGVRPPGWPASWGSNVVDYGMDPDVVNNVAYRDSLEDDLKSIPTFSIVMKLDDLFGTSGIYSNPRNDGRAWERPASLELIYPDGTKGFQSDIGLRVRGGFSRSTSNPKHGLRVFYRAEYGDAELNFPLFGPDGASHFDGFDLRTFNNYSWSFQGDARGTFLRDQVNRDLQLAMGQPAERGDYYHLYINGQYWGLYNTDERAEASYGATYFGGKPDDYDVIKADNDSGNQVRATDGNLTAWTDLYNTLKGTANITEATYQRIQGNNPDGTPNPDYPVLVDVDNLIDYNLVIFYGGNLDAPVSQFINNNAGINNFFAVRNRDPATRQGFRFFIHDAEHTFLDVNTDRTGPFPSGATVATSNPHYFFQRLESNPNFRLRVADHIQKQFFNGGPLSAQGVMNTFLRRKQEIDRAVVAESARWGDSKVTTPLTRNANWLPEIQRIVGSYIPQRGNIVVAQLAADGLWPTTPRPVFGKFGGTVAPGYQLTIRPESFPAPNTVYYTLDGSDPRLPNGSVSPAASAYAGPVVIDQGVTVRARVLQGTTWSAMTEATFAVDSVPLRVTEVMYHPDAPPAGGAFTRGDFEFVEVQNAGVTPLDLSGVAFDKGITFTFPDGTTLEPGAYAVVVRNAAAFASRYGDAVVPAGVFTGGLDDGGERIRLVAPAWAGGQTLIDFAYSDAWQPSTDGPGYSLVPRDPAAPPEAWEDPSRWRASRAPGGTPGAADPGPAQGVAGRWLFYSRSPFDGTTGAFADSSDDNATGNDKRALLPGERAGAANVTSFARGINGLFVDLTNIPYGQAPTVADFVFRVGRGSNPATWAAAPAPTLVAVRRGEGVGGSDRVTIGFADGAIRNQWLQVTVLATPRTGLAAPDVFYFGHLAGDAGDTRAGATSIAVDARDEAAVRRHLSRNPVTVTSFYDFNKDGVVTNTDYLMMRRALGTSLPTLTAPPSAAPAAAGTFSEQRVTTARVAPRRRDLLVDALPSADAPVVR
jgi:hypothetical protein